MSFATSISVGTRAAYGDRTAFGLWASVPTSGSLPILGVLGVRLRSATPCVHWTASGLWALLAPRPRPRGLDLSAMPWHFDGR